MAFARRRTSQQLGNLFKPEERSVESSDQTSNDTLGNSGHHRGSPVSSLGDPDHTISSGGDGSGLRRNRKGIRQRFSFNNSNNSNNSNNNDKSKKEYENEMAAMQQRITELEMKLQQREDAIEQLEVAMSLQNDKFQTLMHDMIRKAEKAEEERVQMARVDILERVRAIQQDTVQHLIDELEDNRRLTRKLSTVQEKDESESMYWEE